MHVQRHRGSFAAVERCRGAEGHVWRSRGAEVKVRNTEMQRHRCIGTGAGFRGAEVQKCRGAGAVQVQGAE